MNRDVALAGAAVGVVLVTLLAVVALPGVLADPSEEGPVRPGPADIAEVNIGSDPADVRGGTVTLDVETRVRHRGNPTPNVTLMVRVVDADSGLVATTETVDVGTLRGDREVPVETNVTVEREGGYHVRTVLYQDGRRIDEDGKTVRGLSALTPTYARTSVGFTDAEALPPLSFSVAEADAGNNRTALELAASLTNRGDDVSEDLRVTFVLRQAESNIVAARTSADVGNIRPGRTETTTARVAVPRGYNYYVDAVLLKDGVVVDSARTAANLDPTKRISVNETEEEVELRVEDFESDDAERPTAEGTETQAATGAPGFGPVVAVAALLAAALLARRRGGTDE
jgi:PGF-CTERM protein